MHRGADYNQTITPFKLNRKVIVVIIAVHCILCSSYGGVIMQANVAIAIMLSLGDSEI
jgi:hypothetical protein